MEWININDRLPEIAQDAPSYNMSIRVIAAWGNEIGNVAEMDFVKEIVHGKEVQRFKWNGKISPWKVTHWQPLPGPPKKK